MDKLKKFCAKDNIIFSERLESPYRRVCGAGFVFYRHSGCTVHDVSFVDVKIFPSVPVYIRGGYTYADKSANTYAVRRVYRKYVL